MSPAQQWLLRLLRVLIGWHFLYEALVKFFNPGWTSAGYLKSSSGPLSGVFQWLASDAQRVRAIDQVNLWMLVAVGLGLMLGVLVRPLAIAGMSLLALYYLGASPRCLCRLRRA